MNKFQLIVLAVFGFLFLAGVIAFSMGKASGSKVSNITVWGIINKTPMSEVLMATGLDKSKTLKIDYTFVSQDELESRLINALAEGRGPDVVIAPQQLVIKERAKFLEVPYSSYPQRTFFDTFVNNASVLADDNGIIAFPVLVDPIVTYWNKRLFSNALLPNAPKTWTDLQNKVVPALVKKTDDGLDINTAAVAMGAWDNIVNAKKILSSLLIQSGTPIFTYDGSKVLNFFASNPYNAPVNPAQASLVFYSDFANQTKSNYTWNNSKKSDQVEFLSENLAMYFGLSSEYKSIKEKNPNLSFDVGLFPQGEASKVNSVFGDMIVLAVTRSSKDVAGSLNFVGQMTGSIAQSALSSRLYLPPARKDLLSVFPADDKVMTTFYQSAQVSKSWYDIDAGQTSEIFRTMVRDVNSGRKTVSQAVPSADASLYSLISNYAKK